MQSSGEYWARIYEIKAQFEIGSWMKNAAAWEMVELQFRYRVIFMQMVLFNLNNRLNTSVLHIFTWNKELN